MWSSDSFSCLYLSPTELWLVIDLSDLYSNKCVTGLSIILSLLDSSDCHIHRNIAYSEIFLCIWFYNIKLQLDPYGNILIFNWNVALYHISHECFISNLSYPFDHLKSILDTLVVGKNDKIWSFSSCSFIIVNKNKSKEKWKNKLQIFYISLFINILLQIDCYNIM